jgi:hypothetical protein
VEWALPEEKHTDHRELLTNFPLFAEVAMSERAEGVRLNKAPL